MSWLQGMSRLTLLCALLAAAGSLTLSSAASASAPSHPTGTDARSILGDAVGPMVIGGGRITGTVTDASTTKPIEGIEVCAEGVDYTAGCAELTNAKGEYTISGIEEGRYRVVFLAQHESLNYVTQYYDAAENYEEAKLVSVTAGASTSGIDAAMHAGGQLAGRVTAAATGKPIEDILACPNGPHRFGGENCTTTNANGEYTLSQLVTGEYEVHFYAPLDRPELDYAPQYYDGQTSGTTANEVPVLEEHEVTGIDAALQPGGHVAGQVTVFATGEPLERINACATEAASVYCAATDSEGNYDIGQLATGNVTIQFTVPDDGWNAFVYPDLAGEFFAGEFSRATASEVPVRAGETKAGIDGELKPGGHIAGRVTAASSGAPLAGAEVCASGQEFHTEGRCANTNANGEYTVAGLTTDHYSVIFVDFPYEIQRYDGKAYNEAPTPVAAKAAATTANIDAEMHEPGEQPRSRGQGQGERAQGSVQGGGQGATAGVAGSTASAGPEPSVVGITSRRGAIYVSLHCGATTGSCGPASVVVMALERLRNGHVVAAVATRGGRTSVRTVSIGGLQLTLEAGRSATFEVPLSAAGKRLLARWRKLAVLAVVRASAATLASRRLQLALPREPHRPRS